MNKDKFVVPGEKLGVIEEFVPGKNVYVDENGALRSSHLGRTLLKDDEVEVTPISSLEFPVQKGDVVLGEVWRSELSRFIIKIVSVWDPRRELTSSLRASLLKGMTTNRLVRVGDLILAKVNPVRYNQISVTLRGDKRLGVVFAKCSNCGDPLKKLGNTLICSSCEDMRLDGKIGSEYGLNPSRAEWGR